MARTTKVDLYKNILSVLEISSLNIHQIAKQLNTHWETVNNALDVLEELGMVKEDNKLFTLQSPLKDDSLHSTTIFDLPLTDDQEKLFCQLANRISELNGKPLKQTFLQKAVVEVIKKANIKGLPYGWYLYGQCCVHKLTNTDEFGSIKKYDQYIIPILEEFSKYSRVDDLLEYLYTKENKDLYLWKLNIIHLLEQKISADNFENVRLINREIMRFTVHLHIIALDEDVVNYFEYFGSSFGMLKELSFDEFERIRNDILSTFKTCWNLIATTIYRIDLEDFYPNPNRYVEPRIVVLKEMLEDQLLKLKESWPETKLPSHLEKLQKKLSKKILDE